MPGDGNDFISKMESRLAELEAELAELLAEMDVHTLADLRGHRHVGKVTRVYALLDRISRVRGILRGHEQWMAARADESPPAKPGE
jgi:hypothetical protein